MRKTILISVRHPGPAFCFYELLPRLTTVYNVHLLVTDTALQILSERYMNVIEMGIFIYSFNAELQRIERLDRSMLYSLSRVGTQFNEDDHKNIENFCDIIHNWLENIQFDLYIRTTPSSHIGIDEIIPTVMKNANYNQPILCLQEYYGVGKCLLDNEHRLLTKGPDAILTVDELAERHLLNCGCKVPIHIIGWPAYDGLLTGIPFSTARNEGRSKLGLQDGHKLLLYASICSDLPDDNDLKDFEMLMTAILSLNNTKNIRVWLKNHPRTRTEELEKYSLLKERLLGNVHFVDGSILDYHECLASADLIVSPASALNIDAMAYAATIPGGAVKHSIFRQPVSLYTIGKYSKMAMKNATGLDILPTHEAGRGSVISDYNELDTMVSRSLYDKSFRQKFISESRMIFKPKGNMAGKIMDIFDSYIQ